MVLEYQYGRTSFRPLLEVLTLWVFTATIQAQIQIETAGLECLDPQVTKGSCRTQTGGVRE